VLAALLAQLVPQPARASTTAHAVRGVQASRSREGADVDVHMAFPFRYLTHAPGRRGRVVRVRLRPEGPEVAPEDALPRQVVVWRHRGEVPLIDVEYDGKAPDGPVLVVHFERPVSFRVSQGRDLVHLRIEILAEAEAGAGGTPELPNSSPPTPGVPAGDPDQADEIMEEARRAMTAGELSRAILLLTQALELPEHARSAEAKELLGLAYQRRGQHAHAHAEYEEYLALYPDSEGAARVRQRLDALLTASRAPMPRSAERPQVRRGFSHDFSSSLSQFYRHNIIETDQTGRETVQSSLDSDLYLTSRHTSDRWSIRTDFDGSYRHDLLEPGSTDATRFTSAFVETHDRVHGWTLRFGRQSPRGGGVLGRYDGANVGFDLLPKLRLGLVSGFPVDFTQSNRIDAGRYFYGGSLELGTLFDHWDLQLYGIQQLIDGIEDRRAVGGELRFIHSRGFGLGLVDYDISYGAVNWAMGVGNWRIDDATSVNVLADWRLSPALTTFNALQGQLVDDIDDLLDLFPESEIREFASDRTARATTFTLGLSRQLTAHWQLSSDVTLSNLSGTEASGGIDAMPGTGNEYYYSLNATVTDLLVQGGYTTFGARYADAATGDRYSISVGGRYPIMERLRIGPRLVMELRRGEDGSQQWSARPSMRAEVRWRRFRIEAEVGLDRQEGTVNDIDADETELYFWLGYRLEL
jgi:hypothetical protein